MASYDAVAYVAGLVMMTEGELSISPEQRTKIYEEVQKLARIASDHVTIYVRWLLLNVDSIDAKILETETTTQWRSRRPKFAEFVQFLRGFFELTQKTTVSMTQLRRIASELDRVEDGMPVRYQHLFFELASTQEATLRRKNQEHGSEDKGPLPDCVDLSLMKDALMSNRVFFPPLPEAVQLAEHNNAADQSGDGVAKDDCDHDASEGDVSDGTASSTTPGQVV